MVMIFQKQILNTSKFHSQIKSLQPLYQSFVQDIDLEITFSSSLDQSQQDEITSFVAAFIDYETVDILETYLERDVFPFIKTLINTFAAENISMGITQAGMTEYVLGLFAKKYPVPSANTDHPISLKDAFDTGSLYSARSIIQYIRDNSSEYTGMSPYITDARLLSMKNKIETFLGIPLST